MIGGPPRAHGQPNRTSDASCDHDVLSNLLGLLTVLLTALLLGAGLLILDGVNRLWTKLCRRMRSPLRLVLLSSSRRTTLGPLATRLLMLTSSSLSVLLLWPMAYVETAPSCPRTRRITLEATKADRMSKKLVVGRLQQSFMFSVRTQLAWTLGVSLPIP